MSDYEISEVEAPKYVLAGTEEDQVTIEDSGSSHYIVEVSNIGRAGQDGTNGSNGVGVPTGGATGKVLKKASNADYDTEWADDNAGTSAVWGAITGTLSNQTDLQNALNAKEASGAAAAAIAAHEAAPDPHPQYATDSQVSALQAQVDNITDLVTFTQSGGLY